MIRLKVFHEQNEANKPASASNEEEEQESDDDLLVSVKNSKYDLNAIDQSLHNNLVISKNPEKKKLKIKVLLIYCESFDQLDRLTNNNRIVFNDDGEAINPQAIHVQNIEDMGIFYSF